MSSKVSDHYCCSTLRLTGCWTRTVSFANKESLLTVRYMGIYAIVYHAELRYDCCTRFCHCGKNGYQDMMMVDKS
jgi:hypothetical protein